MKKGLMAFATLLVLAATGCSPSNNVGNNSAPGTNSAAQNAQQSASNAWQDTKSAATNAWNAVKSTATNAWNHTTNAINRFSEKNTTNQTTNK